MLSIRLRLWIIRGVFIIAFVLLGTNIYFIQVHNGSYYMNKAVAQQSNSENSNITRKQIYFTDKNNNAIPVVLNKEFPTIFAVPKDIDDPSSVANKLSPIVDIGCDELIRMLSKSNDQYELLVSKASDEQVNKIKELGITGIYVKYKEFRYYPYYKMASHILGFIAPSSDGSVKGRYGLEKEFNNWLSGSSGDKLSGNTDIVLNNSNALHLTIDRNIQSEAEKILNNLVSKFNADGGSIIVEDPFSGKILAMTSNPCFDPNSYSKYPMSNFLNSAVESVYEPGSVFKPLTMVAGIDSGAITPNTKYNDVGYVTINGRTIRNWDLKAHGIQTMTNVLEKSLNTGAVFAEKTTDHKVFTDYIEKFGFGVKTGIELPDEVNGNINQLYGGKDINYATASFGQGVSVTPIQLISAISSIANGGILMRPTIIKDSNPQIVRRVMKKETSEKVTKMLISAVDKNLLAAVDNYNVAGKTGTAYIPNFVSGGYTHNVIGTYVGYAPAYNPKFVILIKLDNPEGAPLSGHTVVPAFKKMAEFMLNYYMIPPDRVN